ncbi:uncharacterized protein LOC128205129 isoform X2 [Mya arenaria]|uniref:uncharacterized protein LOC128205129 isoform X2 n=1 Tax=Mya arenaria TaxID=6604 RepID=UPI0022E143DD|nr:uncharacterized protein LOC128205129 isoform X2 [Mya arenaria]
MAFHYAGLFKTFLNRCGSFNNVCKRHVFKGPLHLSNEVKAALHDGKPLVALETTIVTHGMPHPHNLSTALEVEDIVRQHGVIPATIGIIQGKVHIGLSSRQLEYLADPVTEAVKTSRRDLAYVLSKGLNGGTTVSGTMVLAHMAGIPLFVTGGIGGVHRGAESSMDISADLTELGRTPVTVVSAGVKSILDIERTLEYLETQGVCVSTYGESRDFPAFFSCHSGHQAPYNVTSPLQAASLIAAQESLGLQSGNLIAVPIPEQYDTLGQEIEGVIQGVVHEARNKNIQGKEVTPFILKRVNELTRGNSLKANIHLIHNNAKVGAQIAVELSKLKSGTSKTNGSPSSRGSNSFNEGKPEDFVVTNYSEPTKASDKLQAKKRVTVVGGSIVDFTARLGTQDVQSNGGTYPGTVKQSFGGVGRNLADGLSRLGVDTLFISAVGNDSHTATFESHCKHMNLSGVLRLEDQRTATYWAVLKSNGEVIFGIGDMDIHQQISPRYIYGFEEQLAGSDIVCVDGNITVEAIQTVCSICKQNGVPVLYEPADLSKAMKPFETDAFEAVVYTTPNLNELRTMAAHVSGKQPSSTVIDSADDMDLNAVIEETLSLLTPVSKHIPVTMVTVGRHGAMLCYHGDQSSHMPMRGDNFVRDGSVTVEHYPVIQRGEAGSNIVSVSGAGDWLCDTKAGLYSLQTTM